MALIHVGIFEVEGSEGLRQQKHGVWVVIYIPLFVGQIEKIGTGQQVPGHGRQLEAYDLAFA